MRTQKSSEGYVMVDHRASPGLTPEEARYAGYDPTQCATGKLFEASSLTCSHCKVVVVKNPLRTRERSHCFKCNHYICDMCAFKASHSDYSHTPYEKAVEKHLILTR